MIAETLHKNNTEFNYIKSSTHLKKWILSKTNYTSLIDKKQRKYQRIIQYYNPKQESTQAKLSFNTKDEMNIIVHYIDIMFKIIDERFIESTRNVIKNLSATLMRRYYLKCSVLEADVSTMMCTCILLSTKISEIFINIQQMIGFLKNKYNPHFNSPRYIKTEIKLIMALKFDMHIEDSLSSLIGLYHRYLKKNRLEPNQNVLDKLMKYKIGYYKSDKFFLWHPLYFNIFLLNHVLVEYYPDFTIQELFPENPTLVQKLDAENILPDDFLVGIPEAEVSAESAKKFGVISKIIQNQLNPPGQHKRPAAKIRKRHPNPSK